MKLKYLRAPRIKGGRVPKHSSLHPEVAYKIEKLAIKFNCSKSFVIASMLAEFLEFHFEGNFADPSERTKVKVKVPK